MWRELQKDREREKIPKELPRLLVSSSSSMIVLDPDGQDLPVKVTLGIWEVSGQRKRYIFVGKNLCLGFLGGTVGPVYTVSVGVGTWSLCTETRVTQTWVRYTTPVGYNLFGFTPYYLISTWNQRRLGFRFSTKNKCKRSLHIFTLGYHTWGKIRPKKLRGIH